MQSISKGAELSRAAATSAIAIVAGLSLVILPSLSAQAARVLVCLLIAVLGLVLASRQPRWAIALCVGLLVAVPYYALPNLGGQPLVAAAAASWITVTALLLSERVRSRLTWTPLDVAVACLVATMVLATIHGTRSHGDLVRSLFLWLGPYLAFRGLGSLGFALFAARVYVFFAVVLTPFVFVEALTGANPFHHLAFNAVAAQTWAHEEMRLNGARAEASFGHPIALAIFLAAAAVMAIGFALDAKKPAARIRWIGAAFLLVAANAATLSRTGWAVIGIGLLILAPAKRGWLREPRVTVPIAVAAIAIAVLPQFSPVRTVLVSSLRPSNGTELAAAADYRHSLLKDAIKPGALRLLGSKQSTLSGSIDNEYILMGDRWGLFALGALFIIASIAIVTSLRDRRASAEKAILAATAGVFIGLTAVAFITQAQVFVWMLLGTAASLHQTREVKTNVSN